jgi:amidase
VVENLRKAGAVIFGRTNTPAFSWRWATENALHGRTLNPWSREHTPGGSSGGASAAVASGMGPIAHGNDLAGSIRYPAYCTGIVGLRPSFGRVPSFLPSATQERPFMSQLMSVQGPLARCAADLRLALQAMSAGDLRDPWWIPAPLEWPKAEAPIRIALTYDAAGTQASVPVVAALRRTAVWLEQAGYRVEEVNPPRMADAAALWDELCHGEALLLMTDAIANDGDDGIRRFIERITRNTPRPDAQSHMRALARRTSLIRDWMLFMRDYPLVLGPVSADLAFRWGQDVGEQHDVDRLRAAQGPQFMVPLLGLPAISVPCGLERDLPVGVQLIAARFREDMLLDAAEAIEAAFPSQTPIDPCFGEQA